ncbi:HdeD family acid-resistance protein [Flavobacterium cerinum]|uniref:DUF308 domain-containing protein n=1 Tax=Flavobacterium cerinum TaxID=2502784 RepID=A0ABY5IQY9_9FLAO|nr:DUF308 domain-containing protein [Flavobacterium cerinum]UUC45233.1 DUF308 domain-containing protein [Flavobacterium cerinum]
MEKQLFRNIKNAVKHWYLSVIVGILFILFGFWIFKTPMESYVTLALLFGVVFFVNGIFEIIFSVSNRKTIDHWGWILAGGIIDLVFGILLLSNLELSMAVLPLYVGFMLLFRSIAAIGYAFDLKSFGVNDWYWLLILGILGLLFSFIMIWNPLFGGMTIVIWTAMAFITYGLFRVILGFKLRKLHQLGEKYFNE